MANWFAIAEVKEESIMEEGYSLDILKEKFIVKQLLNDAWIVYEKNPDDQEHSWIDFAVCEFLCSSGNNANIQVDIVFHGSGISGSLRELRHSYWGDDGYIYYVNANTIIAAFKELNKYFDCN